MFLSPSSCNVFKPDVLIKNSTLILSIYFACTAKLLRSYRSQLWLPEGLLCLAKAQTVCHTVTSKISHTVILFIAINADETHHSKISSKETSIVYVPFYSFFHIFLRKCLYAFILNIWTLLFHYKDYLFISRFLCFNVQLNCTVSFFFSYTVCCQKIYISCIYNKGSQPKQQLPYESLIQCIFLISLLLHLCRCIVSVRLRLDLSHESF